MVVPLTYDLSKTVNVQFVPEVDAAVDQDGRGRHFASERDSGAGVAAERQVDASKSRGRCCATTIRRARRRRTRAALSLAYKASDDLQFDIGGVAGLNRDAPDVELYAGISRRF